MAEAAGNMLVVEVAGRIGAADTLVEAELDNIVAAEVVGRALEAAARAVVFVAALAVFAAEAQVPAAALPAGVGRHIVAAPGEDNSLLRAVGWVGRTIVGASLGSWGLGFDYDQAIPGFHRCNRD